MASIKGKLFEYFVYRLLVACGFKPVNPDGLLVYNGGPGLMVQGIGQPHNADVLLSPPIQMPFYYQTRLIVECKCYNSAIGLPQIRNALGLREDINHFEIVTEDILKNRRHNRSRKPKFHDAKRYVYQVAVASIDGFASTAFPFAKAHRIPLISFAHSPMFANVRRAITALDEAAKEYDGLGQAISSQISRAMLRSDRVIDANTFDNVEWRSYVDEIIDLENQITIGLLEDGTILFLLKMDPSHSRHYANDHQEDGCTIHWGRENDSVWVLNNCGTTYLFELPNEIYEDWEHSLGKQRRDALRIKRDYFSNIVLFHRTDNEGEGISILRLSERFMQNAADTLDNQNDY